MSHIRSVPERFLPKGLPATTPPATQLLKVQLPKGSGPFPIWGNVGLVDLPASSKKCPSLGSIVRNGDDVEGDDMFGYICGKLRADDRACKVGLGAKDIINIYLLFIPFLPTPTPTPDICRPIKLPQIFPVKLARWKACGWRLASRFLFRLLLS